MSFLASLFGGGGGGGGGLAIQPTETSSTGAQEVGSSASGVTAGGISVFSPGAGLSLGASGVIILVLVALVGVIFVIKEI
jgi:hypothetical protein